MVSPVVISFGLFLQSWYRICWICLLKRIVKFILVPVFRWLDHNDLTEVPKDALAKLKRLKYLYVLTLVCWYITVWSLLEGFSFSCQHLSHRHNVIK